MKNNIKSPEELSSLSVLIVSCDRYSDIWPHFFYLFNKYWPDCPYRIFLGSNFVGYNNPKVSNILIGNDISWADGAQKMVERLPTRYFLFLLEDFFIRKTVKTDKVADCLTTIKKLNGGYLRLRPFPKPDRHIPTYPNIGRIDIGAPYRLSLQAAIWRKEVFLQLVQPGESAWDVELKGSTRSDQLRVGFYCTWEPIIEYQTGITLGKWSPLGIKICEEEKIAIDFTKRPKMTIEEIIKLKFWKVINDLIKIIPWKLRRTLKRFFYPN